MCTTFLFPILLASLLLLLLSSPSHLVSSTPVFLSSDPSSLDPAPVLHRRLLDSEDEIRERVVALKVTLAEKLALKMNLMNEKTYLDQMIETKRAEKAAFDKETQQEIEEVQRREAEIEAFKQQSLGNAEEQMNKMLEEQKKLEETIENFKKQREELILQQELLVQKLQQAGVGHYLEVHSKHMPPMFRNILMKSSEVVTPFFDYLAQAADTNNRLVDHVSEEIDKVAHLNVKKSPFISGLIFYFVVLIPILAVSLLIVHIQKTTAHLTVSHMIIFANLYLFFVCVGCGFAGLVLGHDPMSTFQRMHPNIFIAFLLGLALYFFWYLCLLVLQCVLEWGPDSLAEFFAAATMAIHYFIFVWKRVFMDESALIYASTYLIYATIFGFIVYNRATSLKIDWIYENPVARYLGTSSKIDFPTLFWRLYDFVRKPSHKKHRKKTDVENSKSPKSSGGSMFFGASSTSAEKKSKSSKSSKKDKGSSWKMF